MVKTIFTPLGSANYPDKPKCRGNYYKKKFKELSLFQEESAHQKSDYEKLNKDFTKRKTSEEETVVLYETSDSNYSYISESNNSSNETGKTSIAHDSDSTEDDESRSSSISSKDNN